MMIMMMISVTTCFLLPVLVMSFVLPFSHIPIKQSWKDDVSIHPLMMLIGEGDVVNDRANMGGSSQTRRRDRRSNGDDRISVNDDAHVDETAAVDEKSIEQAMYDLFIQQLADDFGINHGSSSNSYVGGDEDVDRVDDDDDDDDDDDEEEEEDVKMNALEKLSILPARRLVIAPTVVSSNCIVEFILNNRLTIGR
jgi:hypothetical protein